MARLISRQEAAKLLDVSIQTVTGWIEKGYIKGHKTGKYVMVDRETIEQYFDTLKELENLEKTVGERTEYLRKFITGTVPWISDDNLTYYAHKLFDRLLKIYAADAANKPTPGSEWLGEVLTGKRYKEISRQTKLSPERVRQHVAVAYNALSKKMDVWEESTNQIRELKARIKQLETDNFFKDNQLQELRERAIIYEKEKKRLSEVLKQSYNFKIEDNMVLSPVAESLKAHLQKNIRDIRVSKGVYNKLEYNNVTKVIELVSYSYKQLRKLKGISKYEADLLESKVESLGLRLGIDIRWVPSLGDYYLFSSSTSDQNSTLDTSHLTEIRKLRKQLDDLNEEQRYVKSKEENLYSTISDLKLKLVQMQDELESQKKELKRLRIVEKNSYRKDYDISTLKANVDYLEARNKELKEQLERKG